MASLNVGNLGEYLRDQRRTAQLSLRQLAEAAGVSNPYLSQIERGLRKPSAEVLQQVAKALRISAETLYVRAGILDAERDRDEVETRAVITADPTLNERQKQVLLQIYESFRKENGFGIGAEAEADGAGHAVDVGQDIGQVVDAVATTGLVDDDEVADRPADDAPERRTRTTSRTSKTGKTSKSSTTSKTRAVRTRAVDGSDADPPQSAG
ncbi:helix-turn-helix domain-containing protein [Streptomyces sp. NPDC092369]|uniref:helix-turn-helix domain-containing protein n=1 Tax=Streptomyces sp. NPDC092369 TaxID=3366015 RepID=UPI0038025DD9